MSVYSDKTSVRSILKPYKATRRDKAINQAHNRVRFKTTRNRGLKQTVQNAVESNNYCDIGEYIAFLDKSELTDDEFIIIMRDAKEISIILGSKCFELAETLLQLSWVTRSKEAALAYADFCLDIVVAHNKYVCSTLKKLIELWLPKEKDTEKWLLGNPNEELNQNLQILHELINRILTLMPLACEVIDNAVDEQFPPYKKAPHIIAGFLHNVLWLLKYKPILTEFLLPIILKKMILFDVYSPRDVIENAVGDDDEDEVEGEVEDSLAVITPKKTPKSKLSLLDINLPIAHALDLCMAKCFEYLKTVHENFSIENGNVPKATKESTEFLQTLLAAFDNAILPSHDTHHVQFLIFYYCSFKPSYMKYSLKSLWNKIQDPNVSTVIRKASVDYLASFLARAKFVPLRLIQSYLKALCSWACHYIAIHDFNVKSSIKPNLVFYAVCQAIFYIIAFRSRMLTVTKTDLKLLVGLDLQHIITSKLNPLRVCLPHVATMFADITRTYQIAYCHSILEHNSRNKLPTVYAHGVVTVEEALHTVFPFDPYLLKISNSYIEPIYQKWSEANSYHNIEASPHKMPETADKRTRTISEISDDGLDELFGLHKRRKVHIEDEGTFPCA